MVKGNVPTGTMKALVYEKVSSAPQRKANRKPREFEVKQVPVPEVGPRDILLQGESPDAKLCEGRHADPSPHLRLLWNRRSHPRGEYPGARGTVVAICCAERWALATTLRLSGYRFYGGRRSRHPGSSGGPGRPSPESLLLASEPSSLGSLRAAQLPSVPADYHIFVCS